MPQVSLPDPGSRLRRRHPRLEHARRTAPRDRADRHGVRGSAHSNRARPASRTRPRRWWRRRSLHVHRIVPHLYL